jgi:hypothetical protein
MALDPQYLNGDGSVSRRKVGRIIGSRSKQRKFRTKRHSSKDNSKGSLDFLGKRSSLQVTEFIDRLRKEHPGLKFKVSR